MYKTFISGRGYVGEWSLDEINQYKKELRKETELEKRYATIRRYDSKTYIAEVTPKKRENSLRLKVSSTYQDISMSNRMLLPLGI